MNRGAPAAVGPGLADASLLREPPRTPRGARRKATLVAAARTVFERDGYVDARVADITAEAGCATGCFYLYFATKEEILHAVLDSVQDDMLHPGLGPELAAAHAPPYTTIEAGIRAYLLAYQRHARLMGLLEQIAAVDPRFAEFRLARSRAFVERNAQVIASLQAKGQADGDVDPLQIAPALSAMVSRLAYQAFCIERGSVVLDVLVETCTTIWAKTLGLSRD
ncbi:MAG: TetR/AcrR family transcriptional regulator [Nocardioidaceae bacterium]